MSALSGNISVEDANARYQILLKSGVSLSPLNPGAQLTAEKIKTLLGAIGTYQLKWEIHCQRQEKLETNKSHQEKAYAKQAQEALNAAIDAMQRVFEETGFCDLSLRAVQKVEQPPVDQDPLYQVLMARETLGKQSDPATQGQVQKLVEDFKESGIYEQALKRLSSRS